jgi:hypothetical protein
MLGQAPRVMVVFLLTCSFCCWAQQPESTQPSSAEAGKSPPVLHLMPMQTVSSTEIATGFRAPFQCDADGNLYLLSDRMGVTAIRKLNSKGELATLFEPALNSELKLAATAYFAVTEDGEVYALVFAKTEMARYVVVFKSDGSYKNKIKLDPGFPWIPTAMAVFPNGTLLVTGQEYDFKTNQPMLAFTGIFRSDGKLLKELSLEDDDAIHDLAKSADPRVISSSVPNSNRAVAWGQINAAKDGNLYIMRWLSPAIFYAVSPGGDVMRRFTVDPGNPDYRPIHMHISGNRIAVLFYEPQTFETIMKIVDLEGHELATYNELMENGKPKPDALGAAFACYTQQPERFTFLGGDNEHKIQLKIAEAH